MTVVKELWTDTHLDPETKATYIYMMELRQHLEKTCNIAREELEKAHFLRKRYYDRKAKKRDLFPGDKVLALLPADKNKLILSWKGSFPVVERRNELDYAVNLGNKITVFHINMLKKYEECDNADPPLMAGVAAVEAETDDLDNFRGEDGHVPLKQTQD